MVVIEDSLGFNAILPLLGQEYRPKGVIVPPPPRLGYLHVLCDILVPLMRVIVVLPLVSLITTVHEFPRGALLDSRPAFLQTRHFRLFILSSCDLSFEKRNIGAYA